MIFRRWLRHDGFRRAYANLQRTLKTVRDFQSLTAALATVQTFNDALRANRPDQPANSETAGQEFTNRKCPHRPRPTVETLT